MENGTTIIVLADCSHRFDVFLAIAADGVLAGVCVVEVLEFVEEVHLFGFRVDGCEEAAGEGVDLGVGGGGVCGLWGEEGS